MFKDWVWWRQADRPFCVCGLYTLGKLKQFGGQAKAVAAGALGYMRTAASNRDAIKGGWRGWYKTKRWERARLDVFVRDGFVCQKTGVLLKGKHPAPDSPVADHIHPHRGDPRLFWDLNNIQTLSKAYHDSVKQSQESYM